VNLDDTGLALGELWGYAEADATIVGIVVAAIAIFAIAYVVGRLRGKNGQKR
jgi:hypothetical protein